MTEVLCNPILKLLGAKKPATYCRQLKKMKPDLNWFAAVSGINPKLANKF